MRMYDYDNLVIEKIRKIEEKNKDIVEKVNGLECRKQYKNLMIVFLNNIKEAGVDEQLYQKVEQMLTEKSNVEQMQVEHELIHGFFHGGKEVDTFDEMMNECNKRLGTQFYEEALRYSISKNTESKGNIIDNFISYAVARNYDNIEYGIQNEEYRENSYESTLFGYPLGSAIIDKVTSENGKEFISPDLLYIRKNLQGLRIGAFLLKEMMKDVNEKYPGEPLVGTNVEMSNVNALKLYNKLGAEVYLDISDIHSEEGKTYIIGDKVEDPIDGMDHSTNEICCVVFLPEVIQKNAEMVIEKPIQKINNIIGKMKSEDEIII